MRRPKNPYDHTEMLLNIQGSVVACTEVIRQLKERLTSLERRVASIDGKLKARGGKKPPTRSVRYARTPRSAMWGQLRRSIDGSRA